MKAAQLIRAGAPMELREVPLPEIEEQEPPVNAKAAEHTPCARPFTAITGLT